MAPNVVMIMVDDADRKLFDHIPRIKSLVAAQGATVPNFLLNHPICAPSRATILRGQYEHNTGVTENNGAYDAWIGNNCESSNLATWLHGAGYSTALVGKYLNGYGEGEGGKPADWVPPGWDYWFALYHDAGDAYNYDANDNGTMVHYGSAPADYATDVLTGKALQFLASDDAQGPFFLMLTPKAPHGPAIPANEYANAFAGVTYPRGAANPSFNESDVRDKPWYVMREDSLSSRDIANIDDAYRQRLRCMSSVEDMVEAVIGALGSRLSNTYIIFTSDNGYHMGEHRLGHGDFPGGKNLVYEEDIRVPLWVRGPGISAGRTVNQLIGNVDIASTICAMANISPGLAVDGRSFLPLLQGSSPAWRTRYLISRAGGNRAFAGFRTSDNTVFAEFDEPRSGEVAGEYYIMSSDPGQMTNRYNNLTSQQRYQLRTKLTNYRRCAGAGCRTADVN